VRRRRRERGGVLQRARIPQCRLHQQCAGARRRYSRRRVGGCSWGGGVLGAGAGGRVRGRGGVLHAEAGDGDARECGDVGALLLARQLEAAPGVGLWWVGG
jgi:hypothetical protein